MNLRQGPRKVRLVADLIRRLPVVEAEKQLMLSLQRPARTLLTLLRSAVANAEAKGIKKDALVVSSIVVHEGEPLKRIFPRAFGRAYSIRKRASHVIIELGTVIDRA